MKKFILMLIIFFGFIMIVKAEEIYCPYDEQLRLREIAGSTTFSYELSSFDTYYNFIVYISNFTKDIYVKGENSNISFTYTEGMGFSSSVGFLPGEKYNLVFYGSKDSECPDFRIMTKNIIIPYYNHYSEHQICEGYETAPLCQKNSNIYKTITDENDFVNKMTKYIEGLKKDNNSINEPVDEEAKTLGEKVIGFILNYYFYVLIFIIISGTLGIIFLETKRRREIL